uniref:Fatty acid beta-oxidation multifunctional protein II, glyoxysomal (Fragments) n=1 Tax=Cucumis sativus TaxID=3659 RepID=Q7M1X3_CUCSA
AIVTYDRRSLIIDGPQKLLISAAILLAEHGYLEEWSK